MTTPIQRRCRHCGVKVREVNYSLGARWMHIADYDEFGSEYRFCKTSPAAEPEPLPDFIASAPVQIPHTTTVTVWPCAIDRDLAHESAPCSGTHPTLLGRSFSREGMVKLPEGTATT